MERLLLEVFEGGYGEELSEKSKATLDRLAVEPSEENLSNVLSNESCEEFVHHYANFKEQAYEGKLANRAQFWLK